MEERQIRRGDVFWLSAEASGSDQPHPHVVVQEDVFNRSRITTTVVCCLTSNLRKAHEPGSVLLDAGEGGLPQRSVVLSTRISSVAKSDLGERLGGLIPERVEQILAGLRFVQRSFLER